MNPKKISIIGDDGQAKEILAFSERVRIFYERFPRDRYSWRSEMVPMEATNPLLAAISALNGAPEMVKDVLKMAPQGALRQTVHYRCTLRDELLNRDIGSASAFGEYGAYKDLERIESAAFSRMLALVAGINADDLDVEIQEDMARTFAPSRTTARKEASIPTQFNMAAKNTQSATPTGDGSQKPTSVAVFPGRKPAAHKADSEEQSSTIAGPDAFDSEPGDKATEKATDPNATEGDFRSFFFLLDEPEVDKAVALIHEYGLDASPLAAYIGSDKVKLRRILKESARVSAGSITADEFRALINEKIGG